MADYDDKIELGYVVNFTDLNSVFELCRGQARDVSEFHSLRLIYEKYVAPAAFLTLFKPSPFGLESTTPTLENRDSELEVDLTSEETPMLDGSHDSGLEEDQDGLSSENIASHALGEGELDSDFRMKSLAFEEGEEGLKLTTLHVGTKKNAKKQKETKHMAPAEYFQV